jgi:hypothetical protein
MNDFDFLAVGAGRSGGCGPWPDVSRVPLGTLNASRVPLKTCEGWA